MIMHGQYIISVFERLCGQVVREDGEIVLVHRDAGVLAEDGAASVEGGV